MSAATDDSGAEPPALARLVAMLDPKLVDAHDFTLATLNPGLDSGVTLDDWKWLKRQLKISCDRELDLVRFGFAGRIIRLWRS